MIWSVSDWEKSVLDITKDPKKIGILARNEKVNLPQNHRPITCKIPWSRASARESSCIGLEQTLFAKLEAPKNDKILPNKMTHNVLNIMWYNTKVYKNTISKCNTWTSQWRIYLQRYITAYSFDDLCIYNKYLFPRHNKNTYK